MALTFMSRGTVGYIENKILFSMVGYTVVKDNHRKKNTSMGSTLSSAFKNPTTKSTITFRAKTHLERFNNFILALSIIYLF